MLFAYLLRFDTFWLYAAVTVTLTVCMKAMPIGQCLNVLAYPDEARRHHKGATPQVGGIAILGGLSLWIAGTLMTDGASDRQLLYAIGWSALGVGAVGLADDQTGLSPGARVLMLSVFLGAAFGLDHAFIATRLYWGSFEPVKVPLLVYLPLMIFAAGGVVNALNMADGQDGVAGAMVAVWSGCLALATNGTAAALATVISATSLVFLSFNTRGIVFLGNCGSYGVTFVIGLLVTLAHARGQLTLETITVMFFLPVLDCLRLLISRPLRGQSPFRGDRDHFHHRLEDKLGKTLGLMCYAGAVAASSLVAVLAPRFALVCLCLLSAFYFSFAWLTNPDAEAKRAAERVRGDNVVTFAADSLVERKRRGSG